MEIGLVGLPNVGKTTLFNALCGTTAAVADYPFTTIEPNVGAASVPDARLARLAEIYKPQKLTPGAIHFVDVAGLIEGASKGEGMGNQFLSNIRPTEAVLYVLRCFGNDPVLSPWKDYEVLRLELMLADMEQAKRMLEKRRGLAKSGDKKAKEEFDILERAAESFSRGEMPVGQPGSGPILPEQDVFLSTKPGLLIANVPEDLARVASSQNAAGQAGGGQVGGPAVVQFDPDKLPGDVAKIPAVAFAALCRTAAQSKLAVLPVCAKIEEEIRSLPDSERVEFRKELGISGDALAQVAQASMKLLNLISFFTVVGTEMRAWLIPAGSTAVAAAGKIHSDMAAGFIKADVFHFDEINKTGSEKALADAGRVRSEGKDYIVKDGDILRIKFRA